METAGTTPSPADGSPVTLKPSPTMVACGGDDVETVTEASEGVARAEALYLHPFDARHWALTDATDTVKAGDKLGTVKEEGSMG